MEKITPSDIRYPDLAAKRFNKRFTGKPAYIVLPTSTQEVVEAVQEAVDNKRRPVVRSGGHCLEGFVTDPGVQVLIDVSLMTNIYYDAEKAAFAVEAGATVGETYRRLFLGWGVVLPAGEHPGIGMGGHVLGGAFNRWQHDQPPGYRSRLAGMEPVWRSLVYPLLQRELSTLTKCERSMGSVKYLLSCLICTGLIC